MTTKCIHDSDEVKSIVDKNLQDENKLALHHRITIDVLEFIDIEKLRNQPIILRNYEKAKNDYIDKHKVINSDFLLNKLKPIFNENNTFVFKQECKTGNFNFDLYMTDCLISKSEEILDKLEEKIKNGKQIK